MPLARSVRTGCTRLPSGLSLLTRLYSAYDILSPVRSMASEAELISVLDRILDSFPGLAEREWEFHISHIAGESPPSTDLYASRY